MAAIDEIARGFTAMLRLGQFEAAGEKFWAADVISAEPAPLSHDIPALGSGKEAVSRKVKARFGEGDIDDLSIDGPFITGDQFALFLDMLMTNPTTGKTQPFTEIAIFTVRDGRIIEERFFYD